MNDNAKKWLEALASNKYDQTTNILADHINGCYCALGVAVEVYLNTVTTTSFVRRSIIGYVDTKQGDTYEASLPPCVVEWLGIVHPVEVSKLNDYGATFEQIAQTLQENENVFFPTQATVA